MTVTSTLLAILLSVAPVWADGATGTVFILNSYHPGFVWSDAEQKTIVETLETEKPDLLPVVEYLDAKRMSNGEHLPLVVELLRVKHGWRSFSVVVALGAPALEFVVKHHADLFGNAPVVFCGVGDYTPAMLGGEKNITGIVDTSDVADTLDAMLRLQPLARQVFVVHDYTPVGLAELRALEGAIPRLAGRVDFRFAENLSVEDLLRQLENLPDDTLVLLLSYAADAAGRVLDAREVTERVSARSRVAVYARTELSLGHGIVGGKLLSPHFEAAEAVRIIDRILGGADPAAIPVLEKDTSRYMFDHSRMERFRIPLSALPKGSIIIKRPFPFFGLNYTIIGISAGTVAFLGVVIAFLVRMNRQRRRSEAALRTSESRLRTFLDTLPDQAWVKDRELRYLAVNQAYCDLNGCEPSEVLGKTASDFMPATRLEQIRASDLETMRTGDVIRVDTSVAGPDGRLRWFETVKAPLRDASGAVVGTTGIARDITERKQAEEDLREASQFNQQIIQSAQEGIVVYGRDQRYRLWNSFMERLTGFEANEVLGRHPVEVFPFLRDVGVVERIDRALAGETSDTVDFPFRVERSGRSGWASDTSAPLKNASGEIIGVIAIVRDITERRGAEEALRESVAKYRTLVETADDVILVTDTEGRHVFRNGAYYRSLGFDAGDEAAPDGFANVHPDDAPAVASRMGELLERGSLTSEYRVRHRDGHWLNWFARSTVMYDDSRKPYGILSIIRDTTESRRVEAERARLEEQLRQVQKMESIGRLAGGVAHDINNLLSPILGYADLLLSDLPIEDSQKEGLREIKQAAERARDLTRQLLAFSRKQILSLEPVDLGEVLVGFQALLRRTIREDIHISVERPERLGTVRADVGQIQQVLMNLAVNAQDAMPDGGDLTLAVREATLDEEFVSGHRGAVPGDYVLLSITDTGNGMDHATQEHLFEPFYTTKEHGTGLGLSTAFGIVKQHGGSIWVQSEPGRGTTFRIYIPRVEQSAKAVAAAPEGPAEKPRGRETILVVEDMAAVRQLAYTVLTRHGYRVIPVDSAEHALELMGRSEEPVDLVLTDVVMSGMNGRDLYVRLAAMWPGLKVLYMSGHSEDVIAHHGVLDPGVFFVQKPFSIAAILHKVRAALDSA